MTYPDRPVLHPVFCNNRKKGENHTVEIKNIPGKESLKTPQVRVLVNGSWHCISKLMEAYLPRHSEGMEQQQH